LFKVSYASKEKNYENKLFYFGKICCSFFIFQIIDLLFLSKTQGVSGEMVNILGDGIMDYSK
jgi:hypothetical protein